MTSAPPIRLKLTQQTRFSHPELRKNALSQLRLFGEGMNQAEPRAAVPEERPKLRGSTRQKV